MKKVKLYTNTGGYVETVLIPPFRIPPKAISWGERIFFIKDEDHYYEDFWVAAVLVDRKREQVEKEIKEISEGNDDLLFGLPNNLEEAIETFLEFYRNAEDMVSIIDFTEKEFISNTHHVSGQFIRNSWYLWWQPNHNIDNFPKSIPPLVKFFNDLGIFHADDMSGIIITSSYRKINNKAIDLEGQIKVYKNHWKKQGFVDGIFKIKK